MESALPQQTSSNDIQERPNQGEKLAQGDLVLLITNDHKRFLFSIRAGRVLHTHRGKFEHEDLIGNRIGAVVNSQLGNPALLFRPSLHDMLSHVRRESQVIYPKDAAYLVQRLGLRDGSTIIEAGTGSGALTTALAWSVAPTGRVYTYEVRESAYEIAERNLRRYNLMDYVDMHQQSIWDGFQQSGVDALILDLREPWLFLDQVAGAVRDGGHFAALLPTTNQVSQLLAALEDKPFTDVAVEELMLRRYKTVPDRLRPDDEMVGHTGYLCFARTISPEVNQLDWLSKDRKRYRARQKAIALNEAEEARRQDAQAAGGPKYPKMPLP